MAQQGNVKVQFDNPASEEGCVAAQCGMPSMLNSSPELAADQAGNEATHPDEPAFCESGNPSAGLKSGGASKTEPVNLDADQDKEIGTAGSSEGVPLLTFSNEETQFLANKIGHAIIGKFSHTIPTRQQIQKAQHSILRWLQMEIRERQAHPNSISGCTRLWLKAQWSQWSAGVVHKASPNEGVQMDTGLRHIL